MRSSVQTSLLELHVSGAAFLEASGSASLEGQGRWSPWGQRIRVPFSIRALLSLLFSLNSAKK